MGFKSFLEIFRRLRHQGFKGRRIFCPRCGNPNLKPYGSLDGWLTPNQYVCEKCGYVGVLVLEAAEEESLKEAEK
ncbi:MAG: hypothetical protein DRO46_01000 [Candidatus Hecatellales archaeon]|nr:MAG: hypothetical protein DRO46_01000 [Candidatus Hecatellales archaeon]